jgi:hypothetical protein
LSPATPAPPPPPFRLSKPLCAKPLCPAERGAALQAALSPSCSIRTARDQHVARAWPPLTTWSPPSPAAAPACPADGRDVAPGAGATAVTRTRACASPRSSFKAHARLRGKPQAPPCGGADGGERRRVDRLYGDCSGPAPSAPRDRAQPRHALGDDGRGRATGALSAACALRLCQCSAQPDAQAAKSRPIEVQLLKAPPPRPPRAEAASSRAAHLPGGLPGRDSTVQRGGWARRLAGPAPRRPEPGTALQEVILGSIPGMHIKGTFTANLKFSLPTFPSRLITLVMLPLFVSEWKDAFSTIFAKGCVYRFF